MGSGQETRHSHLEALHLVFRAGAATIIGAFGVDIAEDPSPL